MAEEDTKVFHYGEWVITAGGDRGHGPCDRGCGLCRGIEFNRRREDAVPGWLQGSQSAPARRQDTRSCDTCSQPPPGGLRPTIPEQNGRCSGI